MDPGPLLQSPSPSPLEELKSAALAAAAATEDAGYLREAVEQLGRLVGTTRCSLLVVHGERLYHGASIGLSSEYTETIDGTVIGPQAGTCGAAAATGRAVVTADIAADPNWTQWHPIAEATGLRSCWSVPLLLPRGDLLGTFATYGDAPGAPEPGTLELAEAHASLVALGLDRLRQQERLHESYEAVVLALSSALEMRDQYTGEHSTETAATAVEVGRRLGFEPEALRLLEQTALLHDIGKLGVPTELLRAPRALTEDEHELVRRHPAIGERILARVPFLSEVARAVRHEHERWDGAGYPDHLAGAAIPRASRVVFACDAWHAMTSDRPYRPALPAHQALAELRSNAGSQFDPEVVEVLLGLLEERVELPAGPDRPPAGLSDAEAAEDDRAEVLRSVTEAIGAEDLFVFRKISPDRFSHFGGVGRGEGWAGNIEVDACGEDPVAMAIGGGAPVCLEFDDRGRVAGPYYARTAVIVPCRADLVVVFGSSTESLRGACTDEAQSFAERAASVIESISPEKRLADELEVLEAVRSVTSIGGESLETSLSQIADVAARALSCEFGAVVAGDGDSEPRVGIADRGWSPDATDSLPGLIAGLAAGGDELPLLVQDVRADGGVPDEFAGSGATSLHALAIGRPALGVLVLVHAEPTPRGFTRLCRRVARCIAESAEIVIRRALAQEELAEENARLSQRVRTDALTGVASRTAWEDALRREERHRERSGTSTAIAVFDLDRLKLTNDRDGHPAGDELLRACAAELAGCARVTDLVARIGGDEFAVLLRYTDATGGESWVSQVKAVMGERDGHDDRLGLSVSAGVATAPPHESLTAAFAEADRLMYAAKPLER